MTMSDSFTRAKEAADRYKTYQSSSKSEGWGGAEKKGNDSYIGPNELKAMQRDSGLSAGEMNDFFSSEQGQQYFNKNHRSGGTPSSGASNNTAYLQTQADAEKNAEAARRERDSFNITTNNTTTDSNNALNSNNDDVSGRATNTNTQDISNQNPQASEIVGNNNRSYQRQDNSVRNYGGSSKSFVYNGSDSLYDSPMSTAVMSGYYDVDDSPAAQAKFTSLYNDLDNDNQKRFAGEAMDVNNFFLDYDDNTYADYEQKSKESMQKSKDDVLIKSTNVFGDQEEYRGNLPKYDFGADPKPIEDPFDDDKDDDD